MEQITYAKIGDVTMRKNVCFFRLNKHISVKTSWQLRSRSLIQLENMKAKQSMADDEHISLMFNSYFHIGWDFQDSI